MMNTAEPVLIKNAEDVRRLPVGTTSVQGFDINDSAVLALSNIRSLRKLDLSGSEMLTDVSVRELRALTELEDLDLTLCMFISDASLEALAGLPKLRRLWLHGCYGITDRGVVALAESRSLEELVLWACEKLTDRGIVPLAKLPRLRRLELPQFASISDLSLVALSADAMSLETLRLDHLSAISDEGVRSLADLKRLVQLYVQDCRQVTEPSIAALRVALPSCNIVFTS